MAYDATGSQLVSTIAIGEEAQFKYTIKNEATNGRRSIIPANTVKAVISFPTLHGNIRPYIYTGPSTFSSGFFTWTYDPFNEVLVGKNTTAISAGMGDEDITIRVRGYQEGLAISSLNLKQGKGIPNDINNDYGSAQLNVVSSRLSVNLSLFTLNADKCEAILHWKSLDELNFNRYDIEYSIDSINFTKVASVNGKGNNSDYIYSYTQLKGLGYYRLKMIDNEGRYRYSGVLKANTNCMNVGHIAVYPNPVKRLEKLYVNINGYQGKIKGEIFDVKGQRMGNYVFVNGLNEMSVNTMSAGVYVLEVTAESEEKDVKKQTFKIVVLK